jgi:hypothetical protein
MDSDFSSDWRLQGQERYLTGAKLVYRRYRRNSRNPQSGHDHCEFCGAKFMVEDRLTFCTKDFARPTNTDGFALAALKIFTPGCCGKSFRQQTSGKHKAAGEHCEATMDHHRRG